jgi:hypothetical protein
VTPYIYTFIRCDLSHEQKIVQLGHATWEAAHIFEQPETIASLILLPAENERDLKSIARKLDGRGIGHYMFYEPDYDTGYTAICTRVVTDERERSFFRKWDLYTHAV